MSRRPASRKPPTRDAGRSRPPTPGREGAYWLYGHHAVAHALANPHRRCQRLVTSANAAARLPDLPAGLSPETLRPGEIDRLLPDGAVHQGLALLADPLEPPALEEAALPVEPDAPLLLLDRISDPHNVGAILRSAAAFGARAVVVTERHAPRESGVMAKAASGALDHVPLVWVVNLARAIEQIQAMGYLVAGLDSEAEEDLAALPGAPVALALGAEGAGLRQLTRARCDRLVRLPTRAPIASLNVSNAAAVALYALTR